jgi:hypothetical protein
MKQNKNLKTMKTKQIKTLAIALLVILGLQINAVNAQGKKETRKVAEFDKIDLSIPANLYLTQGAKNEVVIEADEDVLAKIETKVDGTSLDIKFEKWHNYKGMGKINVYITVKSITGLDVSGSGDIIAKSAIKAEKLVLDISGSGSILIDNLTVNDVYAMVTGSGNINIKGNSKANMLKADVTGSGDIDSEGIEFKNGELDITGSGSIRANVSDDLNADITGSGSIYYKGNPVIDADITGSGKIRNNK